MSELFNRDIAVVVGTTRIAARPLEPPEEKEKAKPTLRMVFKIEKNGAKEPNKADLQIWNLSDRTRSDVQTKDIPVIIEAGYTGELEQIFSGDLDFAETGRQGVDWVTRLQSGDGSKAYRTGRVNKSFKAGTPLREVIKECAKSIGVDVKNALTKIDEKGDKRGNRDTQGFIKGMVLSGKAVDVFDSCIKSLGLEWNIQDNQMQILEEKETVGTRIERLAAETGLVGSPEVGEDGVVKARSLLRGKFRPGIKVQILSNEVTGFFKINRVVHTGDTWGAEWYSEIEAARV